MDTTAVVALAGIGATLAAGIAGPLLLERTRREGERQGRLLDHRLSVYADMLRATARLADNALTWSVHPLADLEETEANELDRLVSRVRVAGSRSVHEQFTALTRRARDFHLLLDDAKVRHQRVQNPWEVEDATSTQWMDLVSVADQIATAHNRLEGTVRGEVGP